MIKKIFFTSFSFFLIACNFNISAEEKDSPRKELTKAIENSDLSKVKTLIKSNQIEINAPSEDYNKLPPLAEAAEKGSMAIMKYLIENGADIEGNSDKLKVTPLTKIIEKKASLKPEELIDFINYMLENGADINGTGKDNYTPLMAACEYTIGFDVIEFLIENGADINISTEKDETPLLFAMKKNNIKALRFFLEKGIDINITEYGPNILNTIAWEGNNAILEILIEEFNLDINKFNSNGINPLISAVLGGHVSTVQFLLEKGACINATTRKSVNIELPRGWLSFGTKYVPFPKGATALNFAKTLGKVSIANYLIHMGATVNKEVPYKEISSWGFWK